jgi:tetratricopeptide (TPR) repeat protein
MRRTLNLNRGLKWSLLLVLICGASCSKGYNKHADDYYEQGMLFYETMEYGRSIDSFTKVLELAPGGQENNRVYFMRGRGYLKSRQFDQAVYDFTKALELTDEGDTETRFLILEMRGDAFLGKNDAEKAIPDYSQALKLSPGHKNSKFLYLNRGWAFFTQNHYDSAITDFSRAISTDSSLAEAYFARANAWLRKADYPRALEDAKEALKLKPDVQKYDDFMYEVRSGIKN